MFKRKPKPRLQDGYTAKDRNALTIMLLESVDGFPPELICSVLSSALRDKKGIPYKYMRMLAQDLDRHSDKIEREERRNDNVKT